jgi:hypothetical protein
MGPVNWLDDKSLNVDISEAIYVKLLGAKYTYITFTCSEILKKFIRCGSREQIPR